MSEAEIAAFLETRPAAIVVGLRAVGAPSGASARLHYEAGLVGFSLDEQDPMVRDLAADDRACCVVEQFPSYYEIRSVMFHGHARRRTDAAAGEARYHLEVEKVVSFDFGKLPRV